MTNNEAIYKICAVAAGGDTPELRARVDEYMAACPPPSVSPEFLNMTAEEFDAYVDELGGPEVLHSSALAFYEQARKYDA